MASRECGDCIVLIGLPGVGKSTLGIVLAKIMQKSFVDTDLIIQEKTGKSLQTLIDELGAETFIELEGNILREVTASNAVVSTGGSAIYTDYAMEHLASLGKVVYLQISLDSLKDRLIDFDDRGVVLRDTMASGLKGLYDERIPYYERYADITVNIDGLSITEAVRKVAKACS